MLWRVFNIIGSIISTMEGVKYFWGYHQYNGRYNQCCKGKTIKTVEEIQYSDVWIPSVLLRDIISTVKIIAKVLVVSLQSPEYSPQY